MAQCPNIDQRSSLQCIYPINHGGFCLNPGGTEDLSDLIRARILRDSRDLAVESLEETRMRLFALQAGVRDLIQGASDVTEHGDDMCMVPRAKLDTLSILLNWRIEQPSAT